ncbi:MAG: TlpA disulfide reductase family protein [Rhodocyclaceae bacterium]|nr:TlpA disulfide reductase family protein [Rhodocyclaceae bacterium]
MSIVYAAARHRVTKVPSFPGRPRWTSGAVLLALFLLTMNAMAEGDVFFGDAFVGLDGAPAPLARLRGKPLVVNFWARWCAPCRTEIPQLSAHQLRFKPRGVDLVGIAVEDNPQVVQAFVKAYEIDYPILVAKQRGLPLLQALGDTAAALPYTVVFDRRGTVVFRKLGALSAEEMDVAFRAALVERSGETK